MHVASHIIAQSWLLVSEQTQHLNQHSAKFMSRFKKTSF